MESVAESRTEPVPMQTTLLPAQIRSAGPPAVTPATMPARTGRNTLAGVLVGAGTLLLPVAMFLPWYRDANSGGTLSAWDGYWFVIAGMLVLFLAGAGLTASILAGRPLHRRAVGVITGLAFVTTITVVIALFIARPGGNTA